ncbi:hypothetical protein MTR_7g096850 [Medicago truncatula]|uniref:Uncharacterized protein n=1 Tax=Medicago truncatula TaxID=3880 RepID=A0A072U2J5_MEDTR|nr:hypothetical protein MTR_7g096850 [Medicago truncatula]
MTQVTFVFCSVVKRGHSRHDRGSERPKSRGRITTLPIHAFVDSGYRGRVSATRSGSIAERETAALLSSPIPFIHRTQRREQQHSSIIQVNNNNTVAPALIFISLSLIHAVEHLGDEQCTIPSKLELPY